MFNTVLSADVPYAEIAFFAVLAIGLVLGLIRGFSKSFKGVFLALVIMLASLLLITPTFEKVRGIEVFGKMETSITQSIQSKNPVFSTPIYVEKGEDGSLTYWVEVTGEDGTYRQPLETTMGSGAVSSLKGKLAVWLAKTFIQEDGQTIGGVAGAFASDIIVAVIMFIVYCLAFWLVCFLLRKIFAGMRNSQSKALKAIDSVFGGIISLAFAFVFALIVLAILNALQDKIPTVHAYLTSSKICGYFYLNNPISTLFHRIFG